jgi:uncharacterized membrane protein YfcA
VAVFGTLVGSGGGFVLVPVLLLVYPDRDPETITAISLLMVFFNALSGSVAYARMKRIDYFSGLWFAVATLPGAIAGALVIGYVPRRAFDAFFAGSLALLGVYLVLRAQPTAIRAPVTGRGVVRREIPDRFGNRYVYSYQLWKGLLISGGVGFMSSLLGIGGGVVHVPVMATVLHFPVHVAAATSHFVLAFVAAEGSAVHFSTGVLGWDSALGEAMLLSVGALPGAQAGARLSQRVKGPVIVRVLAAALILVAARLGVKAAGF